MKIRTFIFHPYLPIFRGGEREGCTQWKRRLKRKKFLLKPVKEKEKKDPHYHNLADWPLEFGECLLLEQGSASYFSPISIATSTATALSYSSDLSSLISQDSPSIWPLRFSRGKLQVWSKFGFLCCNTRAKHAKVTNSRCTKVSKTGIKVVERLVS